MISTAGLTGITLYAPKELIISARAGTPLHEIEATLAAHGQHLIAEPPDLSALLGTVRRTRRHWAAWSRPICPVRGGSPGARCAITSWACAR